MCPEFFLLTYKMNNNLIGIELFVGIPFSSVCSVSVSSSFSILQIGNKMSIWLFFLANWLVCSFLKVVVFSWSHYNIGILPKYVKLYALLQLIYLELSEPFHSQTQFFLKPGNLYYYFTLNLHFFPFPCDWYLPYLKFLLGVIFQVCFPWRFQSLCIFAPYFEIFFLVR